MLKFWKMRRPAKPLPIKAQVHVRKPEISSKAVEERRGPADTNGTFRRMRQTMEDNRLL